MRVESRGAIEGDEFDDAVREDLDEPGEGGGARVEGEREGDEDGKAGGILAEEGAERMEEGQEN